MFPFSQKAGAAAASPAALAGAPIAAPRSSLAKAALRLLLHGVFLVVAVGCFMAYLHFKVAGQHTASYVALAGAGLLAFAPIRDVIHLFFAIEGRTLHLVHGLGGLALLGLPLSGFVSGGHLMTHAAMAPFAIMGAAQAVMHQDHPRNAKQAAALRTFATSLPEVAEFTGSGDLTSPANAERAVRVLTDIVGKAQVLGETELEADPSFQGALSQASTRFSAKMGLDVVDMALDKMAENPATAAAVPALRKQLAAARRALSSGAAS